MIAPNPNRMARSPFTPTDRTDLALAVLLWRYLGHKLPGGVPRNDAEDRAYAALRLAKRLGIFREYWDVMQTVPVLSVTVRNMDAPKKGTPRCGRKRMRPTPPDEADE